MALWIPVGILLSVGDKFFIVKLSLGIQPSQFYLKHWRAFGEVRPTFQGALDAQGCRVAELRRLRAWMHGR